MRFTLIIVSIISFICVSAQAQPIEAKSYIWSTAPVSKTSTGTTRKLFSGSGAILSLHEMNGVSLTKGKTIHYKADAGNNERFFIIKAGPVTVDLNNKTSVVDRGSVIVLLPGDKVSIENTGTGTAEFYEMIYHSIAAPDSERGKKAGESFVMDWKDMVFKPHDKGGVRQLFDRKTEMLNRFDIHVTQLNEGFNSHPPHTHKNEEIILMMEGNAEMVIGDTKQKANADDVVLLTSNISHNLTNIGKTACLYFAIQWN